MKSKLYVLSAVALLAMSPQAGRAQYGTQRAAAPGPAAPLARPAAPQVKACQPKEVGLNEKLDIEGLNFSTQPKDITVYIGDKQAEVQKSTPTTISVKVPATAKPGKQQLTVTMRGAKANPIEVTIIGPPPELESLSLQSGAPGASLTISGKNFSTNARENNVTIGGAQAEVHSASSGSLSVTIPANIEAPQEAAVSVQVGKQKAKNELRLMIQNREY
jgi:hypothetical protein